MIQSLRCFAFLLGGAAIFLSLSDAVARARSSTVDCHTCRSLNFREMLGANDRVDRQVRTLARIARNLAGDAARQAALTAGVKATEPPTVDFTSNGLNLIWLFDAKQKFVGGATRDNLVGTPLTITGFTPASLDDSHPLLQRNDANCDDDGGVVWTDQGQMAVSSFPVVSHQDGETLGFVVVGRLISRPPAATAVASDDH